MPLYEFECQQCHEIKELLVRRPDESVSCPDCKSEHLNRIISVPAAPAMTGKQLPVSSRNLTAEACEAPSCCGGGCAM